MTYQESDEYWAAKKRARKIAEVQSDYFKGLLKFAHSENILDTALVDAGIPRTRTASESRAIV
jgi:hypothetical protein